MRPRFDDPAAREAVRRRLAGQGDRSSHKSYYPELQQRLAELQRFRTLLDRSSEAILLVELPGGRLVDVNESACRQLGRTREDLLAGPLQQLLEPAGRTRLAGALTSLQPGAPAVTLTTRMIRADGTDFPVEMSLGEQRVEGRTLAVAVARDITERELLQARLAIADRMISVGTLAAGVAHEVNNPLAYVLGNLDFLRRGLDDLRPALEATVPAVEPRRVDILRGLEEAAAALAEANEGAARVRQIVRDLKVFSRTDADVRAALDVRAVLETAHALVAHEVRHRARLVRSFAEVPAVVANEGRLTQVFVNLLVNAAQAIPEGSPATHEIRVATRFLDGAVVVEVSDTGSGIAPEHLPRIFDPFFTTKPVGTGTGLGLAICHGIVNALGGEITVESRLGHGTTFRVSLPVAPAGASDRAAPAATRPPERAAKPLRRLLVVDDDPLCLRVVERLLRGSHAVTSVPSALEALRCLERGERFEVVLCDVMMPGMGGGELLAELERRFPELARRVVFMTGGAFTPRGTHLLGAQATPVLEKPFDKDALVAVLDAVVGSGGR